MKTVNDIAFYMDLFERYHPEYTKEDLKQMTLALLADLPDKAKNEFLEEYRKQFTFNQL